MTNILKKTKSLCPVCLKIIDAKVITDDSKVYIVKECKKHGKFKFLHVHDDPEVYKKMQELSQKIANFRPRFVNIDVTYKCNLNCPFCCNFGGERENYEPSIEELKEKCLKIGKFLTRINTIALFGGEPTLREDLFDIIKTLKGKGRRILLPTNGLKLNKEYTEKLKLAGLDAVLLQFDGLDKNTYKILRGKNILQQKLDAITNLTKNKIPINFFVTLAKDINDNQIGKIVSFAADTGVITITFVPFCPEGRIPSFKIKELTNSEVLMKIEEQTGITKNDFFECTEFNQSLAEFFYGKISALSFRLFQILFSEKGFGKIRQRAPACALTCRILASNSKFIPLNRMVDLKKIIKIIDSASEMRKPTIYFFKEMFKLIISDKNYLHFILNRFLRFFSKKRGRSIEIAVWSYNNRYNADFDLFKYCTNIAEMPDGNIGAFCLKTILQTQIMKKGEYKFNREEI